VPYPNRCNSPRLSFDPDCEPILREGYDDARAISGFGSPTLCLVRSEVTTSSAVNVGAAQPSQRKRSCYVFNHRANLSNLGRSQSLSEKITNR
jgi:hypothetical protein